MVVFLVHLFSNDACFEEKEKPGSLNGKENLVDFFVISLILRNSRKGRVTFSIYFQFIGIGEPEGEGLVFLTDLQLFGNSKKQILIDFKSSMLRNLPVRGFLCDVTGVLYNTNDEGGVAIEGSIEAVKRFVKI